MISLFLVSNEFKRLRFAIPDLGLWAYAFFYLCHLSRSCASLTHLRPIILTNTTPENLSIQPHTEIFMFYICVSAK